MVPANQAERLETFGQRGQPCRTRKVARSEKGEEVVPAA